MKVLSLSDLKPKRFLVIGEVCGDYDLLISLLFQQKASFEDIIVFTGNIIHENNQKSLDVLNFLNGTRNMYSVLGRNEHKFILTYLEKGISHLPFWFQISNKAVDYIKFLMDLPHLILLPGKTYVVNSGLEPYKSLEQQFEDVFYSIDEYDENSKYYQFDNPEKKSWYDFKFDDEVTIIFSGTRTSSVEVPAGISLWRNTGESLKCVIIDPVNNIARFTFNI